MGKFCLFLILLNAQNLLAHEVTFKEEFGQSSLGFLLEEEEDDERYSFWQTALGFRSGDEKATTNFTAGHRSKDFKTRNTDFGQNSWKISAWRKSPLDQENVRWGADLSRRERNFQNPNLADFQELRGALFAEGWKQWDARLGLNFYDSGLQETKVSGQVGREIILGDFNFNGTFQSQYHSASNQDRWRWKKEAALKSQWKPGLAFWEKAVIETRAGQRDTKDADEREDSLDYSFWKLNLKSSHPLSPRHGLDWAAYQTRKDDKGGLFSHQGFGLEAAPSWKPGLGDFPFKLEGSLGWKSMKFEELERLNYQKIILGLKGSLISWGDWKVTAEIREDFYNFTARQNRTLKTNGGISFQRRVSPDLEIRLASRFRDALISVEAGLSLKL